ncbi:MAG: hypothetical protein VYE36_00680 [Chloroflexota bacterium]|nr:hypothetical protein [Chloroflexota bacterium]
MESCSWEEQFRMGNYLANRGDHSGALDCFLGVVADKPNHSMSWNNIGVARLCLSEASKAIMAFEQALKIDSKYRDAYHNRALAYSEIGELNLAMDDLNHAIALDPDHWASYKHRSIIHQMLGDKEMSFKDYLKFKTLVGTD